MCGIIKDRFADPEISPPRWLPRRESMRHLEKLSTARGSTYTHYTPALPSRIMRRISIERRASTKTGRPPARLPTPAGFAHYTYRARIRQRRHSAGAVGASTGNDDDQPVPTSGKVEGPRRGDVTSMTVETLSSMPNLQNPR